MAKEYAQVLPREMRSPLLSRREGDAAEAEAKLAPLFREAEVVFAVRLPPDLMARCPRLKWAHLASHGVDHIPGNLLESPGVVVTSAQGAFSSVVAEHTLTLMLMLARQAPQMLLAQREKRWERQAPREMEGKTVGLVGLGSINRLVAQLARAFGMKVLATHRSASSAEVVPEVDQVFPPQELDQMLPRADFVVLAVPLTRETRHLIGEAQLRAMKPSAYLVNVARGQVVDEKSLIRALREKWIAGAGLDVFSREPLPPDSPLWEMDGVIVTPHNAGLSDHFLDRAVDLFCQNLGRYVRGEPLLNIIDRTRGY